MRLNPLVVAIEKDPDHDNKWTVTDRIVLLGRVRYKLDVKLVEGGCDVDVTAPMGVKTSSQWRVVMNNDNQCTVTEDVTASMPKILAPFVNKTQYQSHEAMFNRLTEELTKEQA